MTPENFTYWLQGALELGQVRSFNEDQVRIIQDHLDLVFNKGTPLRLPKEDSDNTKRLVEVLKSSYPKPFLGNPPFDLSKATC